MNVPDFDSRAPSVSDFIEHQPMGPRLYALYAVGALCLLMDGFDAQGIAFAAPALIEDWNIARAALAPVFAIGLFGMVVGSLLLSPLADRVGRRPILIAATFAFGLCMLCTSFVRTMTELLSIRFLTGVGLGAVMPNVLALTSEYTRTRHRTVALMFMAAGFTLGAAVAGITAALLIPAYGWRALFIVGGIAPLVIGLVMLWSLPESAHFLVLKGAPHRLVVDALARVYPAIRNAAVHSFMLREPAPARMPLAHLFRSGRGAPTLLLWIISFMNLLELYFLSQWLPTLLRAANLPIKIALTASTLLQIGGLLGTVALAVCTRRFALSRILMVSFTLAAVAIATIGHTMVPPTMLLFFAVFAAGIGVVGGQPGVNAAIANYYPTFVRTTGVGWALGIGRFGSIVGPLAGGLLIKLKWGNAELFLVAAVPAVIAAIATAWFHRLTASKTPP